MHAQHLQARPRRGVNGRAPARQISGASSSIAATLRISSICPTE